MRLAMALAKATAKGAQGGAANEDVCVIYFRSASWLRYLN